MKNSFDDLWDYTDPATTETRFLDLLPQLKDPMELLELKTQIARTHSLRKQFEEAHRWLSEVEAVLQDTSPRVQVRYLLEKGRTWNSSGNRDAAVPCFEQAFEFADETGLQGFAADALHMLAIAQPDEAISLNRKALEYIELASDPAAKKWKGSLLNNLGWSLFDAGQLEGALGVFREALQAREEQGKSGPIRIAWWCIARVLRELGRREEALDIQLRLKTELEAAGEHDPYVDEELALLQK
ncbi:tetratricopeptide repeat protein [Deinococcus cellulosilyticus]|uniref:Uncharacterized protein n=1 Tax=Deinococcus cellulosilyticus (strain DSM 18568 / NBRC 106333 / KACC 11606 / 5516J-15) TaxID=1223518 RepID=A0A511N0V2_DEIC1|nr:tetratricopeptide repeat protein [Deinococcus cellulosilyticus]GEM46439.1 hypothetical protein DC3_20740 [Deinococcus cellulosilyticus NBRC 106333 = KACC 11606]